MIIPTIAKKRPRIEIIPLIDIIFFLLATFLMISLSMVKNNGISVDLPTAATATKQEIEKIITISIDASGNIYLDKEEMSLKELSERLKVLKATDPDLKVLINGDEKASFGSAISILDEVRQLGIVKVSIRTKTTTAAGGQ